MYSYSWVQIPPNAVYINFYLPCPYKSVLNTCKGRGGTMSSKTKTKTLLLQWWASQPTTSRVSMVNLILMTREKLPWEERGKLGWGTTVCVCVQTMVSNRRGLQPPPTSANPRAITSDNMKQAREGSCNCIKTAQQEGKWWRVYLMREGSLCTWPDQHPSSRPSIMLPHPPHPATQPPSHHTIK